jgi:type I restriction enzyme S subunit
MNSVVTKKLSDFCSVATGGTPSRDKLNEYFGGTIPWIKSGELEDAPINKTKERLTELGLKNSNARYFSKNTILVALYGATVGKTAVLEIEATTNQAVAGVVPDKSVAHYMYVFYFLRHYAPKLMAARVGGAQPNISQGILKDVDVPLPPLPIQKQIASILEKADAAREKRRQANQLAEQFLQSAFLEMFGDPVTNPKGWDMRSFEECIDSIRYATGSPPPYVVEGIPFIRATNVKGGTIVKNELKYISQQDAGAISKCKVKAGDLILVRSGVNAGDCAIIPPELDGAYAAYDLIIELPKPAAVYYNHLINSSFGKAILDPLKRRAGQPHLNADQIKELNMPVPPIAKLQEFAALAEKVESLKAKQRESEQQLDNLFNGLMQKAFKGELEFSVPSN